MLSHPLPHPVRIENAIPSARRMIRMCLVACGIALLLCPLAHAQGGIPLVTVATDQTPLNLSNQFGIPAGSAINQAGDFAFVGNGNNALFFRAAGATAPTRLLQIGDEVPGFPGSQVSSFSPIVGLNSSKVLLFEVFFGTPDGEFQELLLTYDGTNYHTVVSSTDIAPGSGGAAYGTSLTLGSINDEGDVNFAAVPIGKSGITYYIFPSGATTAVRVVASDDAIPAACTWCRSTATVGSLESFFNGTPTFSNILVGTLRVPQLNAKGQMLISLWGGLFIGSKDQPLSLVQLAASGVCGPPAPSTGGTITGGYVSVSTFTIPQSIVLNNMGSVAFISATSTTTASTTPSNVTITSAICVAPADGSPAKPVVTSGDAAPLPFAGGTLGGFSLWAMDDSGNIVFSTGVYSVVTTGTTQKFALMRYNAPGAPLDLVAYNGEVAPEPSGATFASPTRTLSTIQPIGSPSAGNIVIPVPAFSAVSMANGGLVSFNVLLTQGGNAIYQQSGGTPPVLLALDGRTAPVSGGGTFDLSVAGQTITLDNGSTFYIANLTGGTGDFAEFLGTPATSHSLMSTGDSLPSGARTIFVSSAPKVAGTFVAFMARPAGGRTNLLETDMSKGVTTRVVSDGQIHVPGTPGQASASSVSPNFFVNENGEVAFEIQTVPAAFNFARASIAFGNGNVNPAWSDSVASRCGGIYLWSPSSASSTKIVAAGDAPPTGSVPFSCVELNAEAPSPLNRSGQLAFSSPSSFPLPAFSLCSLECFFPSAIAGVNGVFLHSPGSSSAISEMAAANDTLPGETQQTTFVPYLSVPVNSAGQVAFGAQVGTPSSGSLNLSSGFQGFFLRTAGGTPQKVVSSGDIVPGSTATFIAPHYITGLDDSGNLTFTAATSNAAEGIFFAPAGGNINTIALDGGAAPIPGGGTFALPLAHGTTGLPGTITLGIGNAFSANLARVNGESDVVFRAGITSGTANSGYFRLMRGDPTPSVKPVVLQGDPVPGGGAFFGPIPLGGEFSLGPDGTLAFVDIFTSGLARKFGLFVARPDGSLVRVLSTDDTVPGGGVLSSLAMTHLAAGDVGKFAFLAGIKGGGARQAIFVTALPPGIASATVTLTSPQNSSVFGQPITLTATVNSTATGMPSGSIGFFDNGVSLGTSTVTAGQAVLNISSLTTGSHSILAQFSGDANFAPSNSSALAETITPRVTSTALTSSLSPAVGGQSVTFTATVTTSAGGAPTGAVTFLDKGTGIGTATLNGASVATLTTSALVMGAHSITVSYGGDPNSATSTSSAVNETVTVAGFAPPPTQLVVTAGQSLVIPLTLYAAAGSNMAFMLSCSGLPAGATCTFGPNPVTPGAPPNGTAVQLTLSTMAASTLFPGKPQRGPWPSGFLVLALILSASLGAGMIKFRHAPRRRLAFGMCLAVFTLALAMVGCGASSSNSSGGTPGTPTGLATINVTGASGATTVATVVNVNVR